MVVVAIKIRMSKPMIFSNIFPTSNTTPGAQTHIKGVAIKGSIIETEKITKTIYGNAFLNLEADNFLFSI